MTFPNFLILFLEQLFLISNQMLSIRLFGRRGLGDMLVTIFKVRVRVLKVAHNTLPTQDYWWWSNMVSTVNSLKFRTLFSFCSQTKINGKSTIPNLIVGAISNTWVAGSPIHKTWTSTILLYHKFHQLSKTIFLFFLIYLIHQASRNIWTANIHISLYFCAE